MLPGDHLPNSPAQLFRQIRPHRLNPAEIGQIMNHPTGVRVEKVNREVTFRLGTLLTHNRPNSCSSRLTSNFMILIRAYHL